MVDPDPHTINKDPQFHIPATYPILFFIHIIIVLFQILQDDLSPAIIKQNNHGGTRLLSS